MQIYFKVFETITQKRQQLTGRVQNKEQSRHLCKTLDVDDIINVGISISVVTAVRLYE